MEIYVHIFLFWPLVCLILLNKASKRTVDFFLFRNGKNLGKAFSNINLGPGYAYFPAVSLAASENLRANFGATPLRYPCMNEQN